MSIPQGTEGMRGKSTQGQGEHRNPEETVLKQLDCEIHRLQLTLKIMDTEEQILTLLDELKAIDNQLQGLLHGLEQS